MSASKRAKTTEPFVMMLHSTMQTAAWRALSPVARCVFLLLKGRVGPNFRNNGRLYLSVREAGELLGVDRDTASKGFDDLQAKGFIVVTELGSIGTQGQGKATTWRLTEVGTSTDRRPTKDFTRWVPGNDFPVVKASPPRHRKQTPVPKKRTA